jgi:Uncharacterized alpha/beta hydrolase domain (DUF2235)
MMGVWDTVGSLGSPLARLKRKVAEYLFLDTHLRLNNEYAFHALAIDEHRKPFEPTLWTKTTVNDPAATTAPPRPLSEVEQRWFVGAHSNVGGGYPSDLLAQPSLGWLMGKAASLGLQLRDTYVADEQTPTAPITDSYAQFGWGIAHYFSSPFYRPIGTDPEKGATRTTERINETIDGSVFARRRGNSSYRPPNLKDWASRKGVDPATLTGTCLARDPSVTVA